MNSSTLQTHKGCGQIFKHIKALVVLFKHKALIECPVLIKNECSTAYHNAFYQTARDQDLNKIPESDEYEDRIQEFYFGLDRCLVS